jgi:hypothetical protein
VESAAGTDVAIVAPPIISVALSVHSAHRSVHAQAPY